MLHHLLALTPKQKTFAEYYLKLDGNGPEAALKAYNCSNRNSARVLAHRALHNPFVRAYMEYLLAQEGLPEKIVDALVQGVDAEKLVKVNGQYIKTPDWKARGNMIKTYLRVVGALSYKLSTGGAYSGVFHGEGAAKNSISVE